MVKLVIIEKMYGTRNLLYNSLSLDISFFVKLPNSKSNNGELPVRNKCISGTTTTINEIAIKDLFDILKCRYCVFWPLPWLLTQSKSPNMKANAMKAMPNSW